MTITSTRTPEVGDVYVGTRNINSFASLRVVSVHPNGSNEATVCFKGDPLARVVPVRWDEDEEGAVIWLYLDSLDRYRFSHHQEPTPMHTTTLTKTNVETVPVAAGDVFADDYGHTWTILSVDTVKRTVRAFSSLRRKENTYPIVSFKSHTLKRVHSNGSTEIETTEEIEVKHKFQVGDVVHYPWATAEGSKTTYTIEEIVLKDGVPCYRHRMNGGWEFVESIAKRDEPPVKRGFGSGFDLVPPKEFVRRYTVTIEAPEAHADSHDRFHVDGMRDGLSRALRNAPDAVFQRITAEQGYDVTKVTSEVVAR